MPYDEWDHRGYSHDAGDSPCCPRKWRKEAKINHELTGFGRNRKWVWFETVDDEDLETPPEGWSPK